MASKKLPAKPTVAQAFKAAQNAEDKRKAARKTEGTASKKTVENQFNPNQNVTVFGKKIPKSVISRSEKLRPKRKSESEPEWLYNVTKEELSAGAKAIGKGIKNLKGKLRK